MFNVVNVKTHEVMLGADVPDLSKAMLWTEYYRQHYGDGVPFANGKGYYDGEFMPCFRADELHCYIPVQ